MRHISLFLVALIMLAAPVAASAQYYSWGADAESMSWRRSRHDGVSIIYPDTASQLGAMMDRYTSAVSGSVDFGYRFHTLDWPFVIHPENFSSNGLTMWLPKRIDILSTPAENSYSMLWLKQLSIHEFRHAAQYSNLRRGWPRVFSWFFGDQGAVFGILFMPLWGLEGDAVLAETEMSTYGRALQPSFTINYRAMGAFHHSRRNIDKWYCGSFKDYVPDHYHIGYQVTAYADNKYGENVWDKVVHYAVRNPYVFATTAVGMKKFYHTGVKRLTMETFDHLDEKWSKASAVDDSTVPVPHEQPKSYTVHSYPLQVDSTHILSIRKSMDRNEEFVLTDTRSGQEKSIARIGSVSSRPVFDGRNVYWTEARRSMLYDQRVNSILCTMELGKGKPHAVRHVRKALYPTVSGNGIAYVEYAPSGVYTIVDGSVRHSFPIGTEIHGLDYDSTTGSFYVITTTDDGMGIFSVKGHEVKCVRRPAFVTISDLRARDGYLYFGSIASGKDEVHRLCLSSGIEHCLTQSRYGSFQASPASDGKVVATTFDACGYHISTQEINETDASIVPYSPTPKDILNPQYRKWSLPNIDTVRFCASDSVATASRSKRYSKLGGLFKFHSWAPFSFSPYELSGESLPSCNIGATVMTQNLLSTMDGYASYGWHRDEGHMVDAALYYSGLGVRLGAEFSYGGNRQYSYPWSVGYDPEAPEDEQYWILCPESDYGGKRWSIGASATLPMYFQRGNYTRLLSLSTAYRYSNDMIADTDEWKANGCQKDEIPDIQFREGMHTLQFGASFQNSSRLAKRDFLPRMGQTIAATYALSPCNDDCASILALYGRLYLPGVAPHHSLQLSATYQHPFGGFRSSDSSMSSALSYYYIIPEGYTKSDLSPEKYVAAQIRYSMPVWYPDGGIPSVLYFQRIRLSLGLDFASFRNYTTYCRQEFTWIASEREYLYSYGGSITFDVNFFRMPSSALTSVTVSVYKPTGKNVFVSAGLGLPF